MAKFRKQEVLDSFRKFNDLKDDIDRSKVQSWTGCLKALLSHCENNPVMKVVVSPLDSHPGVDVNKWLEEVSERSAEGYILDLVNLPIDDNERTAFLYQLLKKIVNRDFPFQSFCFDAFRSEGLADVVDSINTEFIDKFTREVAYRLEDIKTEIGDEGEVSDETLFVFNYHSSVETYHGPVQKIEGGVHNSIVATNSTVSGSKLTFNDSSQFANAVKALGEDLNDILEGHQDSVKDAFDLLVKAIESNTAPKLIEVAPVVQTIGDGSPSALGRLRGIIDNAAGGVLGEAIKSMISLVAAGNP